jgi:hypothetical protein
MFFIVCRRQKLFVDVCLHFLLPEILFKVEIQAKLYAGEIKWKNTIGNWSRNALI